MLISFKVSNSRSIGKELEFSAIATDDTILPENTIDLPKYGIRILKTMALFGANASGKSNILKAMTDARNIICKPEFDKKDIFFPFNRNKASNISNAITYAFAILIDNIVYNYSFSHNSGRILTEKLTENIDAENERLIYQRNFNVDTKKYEWLPESFFGEKNTNFFQLSTAEHKLFLTIANNPANPDAVEKHILLDNIYNWFFLQFIYAITENSLGQISYLYLTVLLQTSPKHKKNIVDSLKKIDVSIENIEAIEVATKDGYDKRFTLIPQTNPYGQKGFVMVKTYHRAINKAGQHYLEEFDFFTEESMGTKTFVAWIGSWLYEFQKNEKPKIFVIDELGTSLHPKLTLFLMKLFANKETNPYNSQLIFTTHEVKLMDKTVMRPDQLFLVNKDNHGDTSIERTSDYAEIEKYSRLDNLYMHGGMSGIPMINL